LTSLSRIKASSRNVLSGLSPDALCRIQLTWITRIQTWSLIFILTQSKLCR